MRGNIHSRLDRLEERAPKPKPERPLVRPELRAYLDEIAERKRAGTLTPEDEEFLDAAKAEIKRREARGEISRWWSRGRG